MKRVRTTFTIDEHILDELDEFSEELDTKKSHIVESSLTDFFDYLDVLVAEKRLAELASGKTKAVSAAEVWKDLDLE